MRMSKRADPHGLRSKHRSALRLCLGTAYYSARRYLLWMSGKYRFASQRQKDRLPCVHMAHHTPLLRKLKDVEMQYQHNKITNLKLAVARLDGMVVFVQGGIRGEACDVRLTHVGRSALWGRVEEVVNPSPARIFPRCLHYTKCGG